MTGPPLLPCLSLAAATLAAGCAARPEPADLVLLGGKLVTLEAEQPEAQALAARDGRIVLVGSDVEARPFIGPDTRVIELDGQLAIPGFVEGHGHFAELGRSLTRLDLSGARTWDDVVGLVAGAASRRPPGEWILGRGWHQEKWEVPPEETVEGYPVHDALSRAAPEHPVLLDHASGHAAVVNARALERAGIDRATADPPGGTILRRPDGRPSGVLRENAADLAHAAHAAHVAGLSGAAREAAALREIELAERECLSKGVTSFQDAGADFATIDRLRGLAEAGRLGLRLYVMLRVDDEAIVRDAGAHRIERADDPRLTVRAIKRQIDGALGSHGAWLLEPYRDLPSTSGLNTLPLEDLERTARLALEHGLQLAVHAIGDRGNRETLDLFERLFREHPAARDLRWRIEHAQHLSPQDVPRFAALGVIASMQAVHCTSDAPWVPQRLGPERAASGAYVWRALLDAGAVVTNGTDTPVEDVDPLANFHAAVTRRVPGGEPFHPEQRMTRAEALRAATLDAAFAAFEEDIKGSLRPGKLADVTVLSRDILAVPEERIPGTEVLYTIVGGEVLHERHPPGGAT